MSRAGHYLIALASAVTVASLVPTLPGVALAIGVLGGGNLPDDLEFPSRPNADGSLRPTLIPHRTITHFPWWYVAAFLLAAYFRTPLALLGAGLALGSLIHLLTDSVSPHGIPLLSFSRSMRPWVVIYKSRTASEWRLIAPAILLASLAGVHSWPLLMAALSQQRVDQLAATLGSFLH